MSNILNIQSFSNLPTCSAVPSAGVQLINKAYADSTYAVIGSGVSLGGTNAWTGTNSYNTNLPTSTLTPTTSTQLVPKSFTDATYGGLTATNAWTAANTFAVNPAFQSGATVGYIATCTSVGGLWTWQASPVGPATSTVTTSDATPTTLASITIPSNGVVTISGLLSAANATYTDATGGTFSATVVSVASVATLVSTPLIVVNASSSATFNVIVTGSNLIVQVTGIAATVYNWKAEFDTLSN